MPLGLAGLRSLELVNHWDFTDGGIRGWKKGSQLPKINQLVLREGGDSSQLP